MDIPVKELKSGFSLPVYGLGTWHMGGSYDADPSQDKAYESAIHGALERGVTHIDTAEMYGDGHCEEIIGRVIKGRKRHELIITTKVWAGMDGGYDGVLRSAEASLRRLGCDYLDLYLLHRAPRHSTADVMRALDRLVEEGMVRFIGVSNFTANRWEEAQKLAANELVCNQVHYSVKVREAEARGITGYARKNDALITAWGPLEKGMLEAGGMLEEIARKYDKTPYQAALNWLIAQPNVVTIPKTAGLKHLDENLGALGWNMDEADLERLSKDFPGQSMVSDRVPLDYPAELPA
ncbi:MAG TPA: aldo/keto reductase [Candidatus Saccharimonadales bacterium]|nr:aldo/keto reductase [Candidatus Saccharimonadales bacterium]